MHFENCALCSLTFAVFVAAGPVPQRSQYPDLSPLTSAANEVSPLSPGEVSSVAVARQGRALFFNVNDVVEQKRAGNNEACAVINNPHLSTTICSTFGAPRSTNPTVPTTDIPAATADVLVDGTTRITSTQTVTVIRQPPDTKPPSPPASSPQPPAQ
ncbi:hypothetical protein ACJ73_07440 [Blastomyces percursus]|uniref:Uncharacterized protein n=1 Tax=Blastomyces percursus TaxID=1658174 RepID=A0A1J9PY25_9EURO|nr:hypothetical protein ACJ73_07440 [Blastomyces percursus]